MKLSNVLLIMLLACCAYAQENNPVPEENDYAAFRMSDKELKEYCGKINSGYDARYPEEAAKVERKEDISEFLNNEYISRSLEETCRGFDADKDDIALTLIQPLKLGWISSAELIENYDSLRTDAKEALETWAMTNRKPDIEGWTGIVKTILDNTGREWDRILIKVMQNYDGYMEDLTKAIHDNDPHVMNFFRMNEAMANLIRSGKQEEALAFLDTLIDAVPEGENSAFLELDDVTVFERLWFFGDSTAKGEARRLVFRYLRKASPRLIGRMHVFFRNDRSPEFTELLEYKMNYAETIQDESERLMYERWFQENWIEYYARIFGIGKALEYISPLLMVPEEYISREKPDSVNYSFADHGLQTFTYYVLRQLKYIVADNDISGPEKTKILKLLKAANLQNALTYHWQLYMDILKSLYPDKSYEDFSYMFESTPYEISRELPPEFYWKRREYTTDRLPLYLKYFEKIGLAADSVSDEEILVFNKNYRGQNSFTVLFEIFEMAGILASPRSIEYEYPCNYFEQAHSFITACRNELPGFYVLAEYSETVGNQYEYKLTLTNGKLAYIIHPVDTKNNYIGYNPDNKALQSMFNLALRDAGTEKRFIDLIADGKMRNDYFLYCSPGQADLIINDF